MFIVVFMYLVYAVCIRTVENIHTHIILCVIWDKEARLLTHSIPLHVQNSYVYVYIGVESRIFEPTSLRCVCRSATYIFVYSKRCVACYICVNLYWSALFSLFFCIQIIRIYVHTFCIAIFNFYVLTQFMECVVYIRTQHSRVEYRRAPKTSSTSLSHRAACRAIYAARVCSTLYVYKA